MHDNVVMVVTQLAQYLLIAVVIGAFLGVELARSNRLSGFKGALRGGSVGLIGGLFVVATVTTFLSYF